MSYHRLVSASLWGLVIALPVSSTGFAQQESRELGLGALLDKFRQSDGAERESVRKEILALKPAADDLAKAVREHMSFLAEVAKGRQQVEVPGAQRPVDLYVPEEYDPKKKWPVMVGLHGTGGKGDQILEPGMPACKKLGWILICPTLPDSDMQSAMKKAATTGFGWGDHKDNLALKCLEWVFRRYHCDSDRVYLMGVSQGGYGAWGIGTCYSFRFAAVLPYAGGIDYRENFGAAMGMLDKLPANGQIPPGYLPPGLEKLAGGGATKLAGGGRRRDLLKNTMNTPVYFVHGAKDTVVEPAGDRESNEELNRIGSRNHKYVEKPTWGHVPTNPKDVADLLDDMTTWASKKERPRAPRQIFHFSPRSDTGESHFLRLDEFTEGASVEATRSGNRFVIKTHQVKSFTLFLDEDLVNLSKPVSVSANGRTVWSDKAPRSAATVLASYENGFDPLRAFPAAITIAP